MDITHTPGDYGHEPQPQKKSAGIYPETGKTHPRVPGITANNGKQ